MVITWVNDKPVDSGHMRRSNEISLIKRLTIVRDELLEALPLVENIKTFWFSRYSLIKLT